MKIESEKEEEFKIFHPADMERILFMFVQSPNGIQTMSMELPGLVESSLNMGIVRTEGDEDVYKRQGFRAAGRLCICGCGLFPD